jgi:hypothetical protein
MASPSVPYKQLDKPAPRIGANPQGLTATVRYSTSWADAFTFVNEILGIFDGNPWIWPSSPNIRAYDAQIEPVGVRTDVATQPKPEGYGSSPGEYYEQALISVTFGSQSSLTTMPFTADTQNIPPALQFDPQNPIEMSSYSVQYGTEAIKVPGGSLKWAFIDANGNPETVPAGVKSPTSGSEYWQVPTFKLNIVMHNCLYLDTSLVADKIGKVNDATIFNVCEPETLLLNGVTTSRRSMSDGAVILDVTLGYSWRKIGWNVAFASNGVLYRYLRQNSDTNYPKTSIHPNDLFPPLTRWKPTNLNGIPGR